jgi:hypothetical protein
MSNNSDGGELGRVVTPGDVVYRLFDDGRWEVAHAGRRMPASEASIMLFYQGHPDFPAYPGQTQLVDLARRTRGTLIWKEQVAPPDVEVE